MTNTSQKHGPVISALATAGLALVLSAAFGRRPAPGATPDYVSDPTGGTSAPDPHRAAGERDRGRTAAQPQEIPPRGWWDIMWRVYEEIGDDRILAVAAGVTFYGLLALFPAIGAFVSLYGLVADPATISEHLNALSGFLPGGALDVVGEQIKRITTGNDTALGFAFFSGLAISVWSANAGMKAVFDALNVAYEEKEKRSFIALNLTSLAFTFGAIVFLVIAMSGVVVVPVLLKFIGLGAVADWVVWIGRWPALLLVTMVWLAVLYRYGPSRDRARWSWLAPGSILAAAGWMIFSMIFSWYVGSFGNYNETYGSLGAVVGFMTWMWLSVTIILVGAELNAETEHQTAHDTTEGPHEPLGARGAEMADTVGAARA
ncbi:YihY/virulence factor BrkB family protein [Enterovirga aerilata]|uniref:YihY/virulence factor BrkB family protein n=1 Tax=Enterovirga aerilata TaxID=2730920 RepID=A0A849I7E2_9HYPH|nr:YihY/virulence factor BrkB family protein [Enterovirga sp. DB1703]NNM73674.1 YihY/virulence factor BrkB family protein [Enterovirga sp. DB1703]